MADEPDKIDSKPDASPPVRSVWHWLATKRTPAWAFNGAAAGRRWATSPQVSPTEITEAEYDAAIVAASGRQ